MGIPHGTASPKPKLLLSPLGEACSRMDLTAIHEILEKLGYKDDEGIANEVSISMLFQYHTSPFHLSHFWGGLLFMFPCCCASLSTLCIHGIGIFVFPTLVFPKSSLSTYGVNGSIRLLENRCPVLSSPNSLPLKFQQPDILMLKEVFLSHVLSSLLAFMYGIPC